MADLLSGQHDDDSALKPRFMTKSRSLSSPAQNVRYCRANSCKMGGTNREARTWSIARSHNLASKGSISRYPLKRSLLASRHTECGECLLAFWYEFSFGRAVGQSKAIVCPSNIL